MTAHALRRVPAVALLTSRIEENVALSYDNVTDTAFEVTGNTIDGSSPALAFGASAAWLAL